MVYEKYFSIRQQHENSVLIADAAMQVAIIMEDQNRLKDAYKYVEIAHTTYREVYGDAKDNTIISHWLKLQIAYNQSNRHKDNHKDKDNDKVLDMANDLFEAL